MLNRIVLIASLGVLFGASVPAQAQDKQLTLCWAAWDPANALAELSKDFTAKTGVQMKFEFVPWPNFADRMLNELKEEFFEKESRRLGARSRRRRRRRCRYRRSGSRSSPRSGGPSR